MTTKHHPFEDFVQTHYELVVAVGVGIGVFACIALGLWLASRPAVL